MTRRMTPIPLTVALMTYNRAATYLRAAIEGVLAQTYTDFEFLILDNHSTDETPAVVLGYHDPRIRYVRNAPGYHALFNGISAMQLARGKRLIITHDDDLMTPSMLERQMALMDANPEITAVWTNVSVIDETGAQIQSHLISPGPDRIYERGEYLTRYPMEQLLPLPSTLMLDMTRTPRVIFSDEIYRDKNRGERRPRTHGGDDVLIPALLNTRGSVVFLNEPLLKYRRHSGQDTHDVHISKPVLNTHKILYKLLRKFAHKIPGSAQSEALLGNYVVRYAAQDIIVNTRSPAPGKNAQKKLQELLAQGLAHTRKNPKALYPFLPLALFLAQREGNAAIAKVFEQLEAPDDAQSRAVHASYRWLLLRQKNKNILRHIPPGSRIAILGSALIAALLIQEARAHGLHAVCLDSKSNRQGQKILGVPIHAPNHLKEAKDIEYVVLSSEREQDDYLQQFIHSLRPDLKVVSWKNLSGI